MLTNKAIELASDGLFSCNFSLQARPGSYVAELVASLAGFQETGCDNELYEASVHGGVPSGAHSRSKEAMVKNVANIMRNAIDTATNIVNPLADKCLKEINSDLNTAVLEQHNLLGNVKQIAMPALFTDYMFQNMIEPCRNSLNANVSKCGKMWYELRNNFTNEELGVLLATGSQALDEKVALYTKGISIDSVSYDELIAKQGSLTKYVYLFFLFTGLLARPLDKCNEVLDRGENVVIATACKMVAGAVIYAQLDKHDVAVKRGDIVALDNYGHLEPDNEYRYTVFVYTANYLPWIQKNNGSPEAILGYKNAVSDISIFAFNNAMMQEPAKWADSYNRALQHADNLAKIQRIRVIKFTTRRCIHDFIKLGEKEGNTNTNVLYKQLEVALTKDYYGDKDLYEYVITVITETLVTGDLVKRLLLLVDNLLKEQSPGENDLHKAIYFAIKEVLATWIAQQVQIK